MSTKPSRRSAPARHRLHSLCDSTPRIPWHLLSPLEKTAVDFQKRFRQALDAALPPDNAPLPSQDTPSIRQAVISLVELLYHSFGPRASPALLRALVAQRVPYDLVHALDRALRFRDICVGQLPSQKPCIPGAPRPNSSNRHTIEILIIALLRAFAASPHQVLKPAKLHHNPRLFRLLFSAMSISGFVEISLFLVETLLHLQSHPRLDLSQIPNLSNLVKQLTPYQLGAFCRVLSLIAEESDGSSCAGGICSGQCADDSPDWHHIKPMTQQLKERRSYLDPDAKALIHRNHATLLAIPEFLNRLVKLISRPPTSRDDLLFVDTVTSRELITVDPTAQDDEEFDPSETPTVATTTITNINNTTNTVLDDANADSNITNIAINALNNLHINNTTNHTHDVDITTQPTNELTEPNDAQTTGTPPHTVLTTHGPVPDIATFMPNLPHEFTTLDPNTIQLPEPHHGFGASPNNTNTDRVAVLTTADNQTPAQTPTDHRDRRSDRNGATMTNTTTPPHGRRRRRRSPDARNPAHSWEILDESIAILEREYLLRRDMEDTESDIGSTSDASRAPVIGGFNSVDAVSTTATASDAGNETLVDAPSTEITSTGMDNHTRTAQSEASDTRSEGNVPLSQEDGASADPELFFNPASQLRQPISLVGALMLAHHVDIFFVLYCLVLGKRRSEVQAELIKSNIFSVVKRYWHALEWVNIENESDIEHNLKLHLVRFLHFMCDKTEDNTFEPLQRPFFSENERRIIKDIEQNLQQRRHFPTLKETSSDVEDSTRQLQQMCLENSNPVMNIDPDCSVFVNFSTHITSLHCNMFQRHPYQTTSNTDEINLAPLAISWKSEKKGLRNEDKSIGRNIPRMDNIDSQLSNATHERGLITEITHTFMQTRNVSETAQLQRYMLSGCLESFLRGASEAETVYLGRQGLLVHLLTELGKHEITNTDVNQHRQTSFDVLSQLVRWSRTFFQAMNLILKDNHGLFTRVLDAVSVRLIDSNVFVRSIALSLERFRAEDEIALAVHGPDSGYVPYDFNNCVLWEFIQSFRIRIMLDLLVSVRVEEVSYENICCVNTTLILFVLSCPNEDSMDQLLSELATETISMEAENKHQILELCTLRRVEAFDNFAKLIDFWLGYYRHQGTDVHSLEVSSDIPIEKFVHVANMLKRLLPAIHERVTQECEAKQLNGLLQ